MSYNTKIYHEQGGDRLVAKDGGIIALESGQLKASGELLNIGLANPYYGIGNSGAFVEINTFSDHIVGFASFLKLKVDGAKTLLGAYHKVSTDGSTTVPSAQLVAVAPRVVLDQAVDTAYGVQSHLTHAGTGNVNEIMAVSAYINTAGNYSASGRVTALQAMIEGTSTITGDVFVVYAVAGGTIQTVDSIIKAYCQSAALTTNMLLLDNDSATGHVGISLEGKYTHGLKLSDMTLVQGNANHYIEIGTYASAITISALTDHVFASVTNIEVENDGGSSKWVIADYSKITITNDNAQPNTGVAVYRPKLGLNEQVANAWGIQLDVNCTGSWSVNDLIGVGVFLDLGAGTITSTPGKVAAIQADVYGEGTAAVTGNCYCAIFRGRGNITGVIDAIVQIENQNGVVAAAIGFDMDGGLTQMFLFNGSACAAFTTGNGAIHPSANHVFIPVKVQGTAQQLYIMAAETWS